MNMTKISTLLTSIALASSPIFAQAYQIAPNPNPVDNTIDILGSDAEASNFTNLGILHIGSSGILNNLDTLENQSSGTLNIDTGGTLSSGINDDYRILNNAGTLNNNGNINTAGILNNKSGGILNNDGIINSIYTLDNAGTLNNNLDSIITISGGGYNNKGTLNNYGTFYFSVDGNNMTGGIMNNYGTVSGWISTYPDSILTNNGTMNINGMVNLGTINGSGLFNQFGQGTANFGSITQTFFHFTDGVVSGTGTFTGDTTIDSTATINPGVNKFINPLGILSFNGDFHSSGNFLFDIAGTEAGSYDTLVLNGNSDVNSGNVVFNFINGFHPAVGDHWNFLLADSITGLDSLNLSFAGLPDSSEIKGDITFDNLGGHLVITALPVPEPETYAMLLAGLGLLGFVARRRKEADTTNAH